MLCVVVIMFAVSWLPMQTFSMVVYLFPALRQGIKYNSFEYNLFIGTYFVCHWLSMAHSCLNPLIYCFMNDKFLNDLRDLVCRTNPGAGIVNGIRQVTSTNARLVSQNNHQHHNYQPNLCTTSMNINISPSCTSISVNRTKSNENGVPKIAQQLWIQSTARDTRRRSQPLDQNFIADSSIYSQGDNNKLMVIQEMPHHLGDSQSAASSQVSVAGCCLRVHHSIDAAAQKDSRGLPGGCSSTRIAAANIEIGECAEFVLHNQEQVDEV